MSVDTVKKEIELPYMRGCEWQIVKSSNHFKTFTITLEARESLKPCPMCGGEAGLFDHAPVYVYCLTCDISTPMCKTTEEAKQLWNARV